MIALHVVAIVITIMVAIAITAAIAIAIAIAQTLILGATFKCLLTGLTTDVANNLQLIPGTVWCWRCK